jgi:type I restriction enzyme S subunit
MTEYLHSIAEGSTSTYPSLKPEDIGNVLFLYPGEEN